MKFDPDSRGSKNRTRPSSARASVYSFPFGYGTDAGRAYPANRSRSPARSLAPPMAASRLSADAEASEATIHRTTLARGIDHLATGSTPVLCAGRIDRERARLEASARVIARRMSRNHDARELVD